MRVDKKQEWWSLTINLAGPGVELEIVVESNKRSELDPPQKQKHGLNEPALERYGSADEFIEVRSEFVVAREITKGAIEEEKKPTGEGLKPPPTKEEQREIADL